MDVVRAFVSGDRFQIDHVADDAKLVGDAVAAQHVAGVAGDLQRLAGAVAFHQRDQLRCAAAVVHHAAKAQRALDAEGDFALHVDQLFLDQLRGGERPAELLAVQRVLPRRVPAAFGGAQRAPGNAVAGGVEAGERTLQAADLGQQVFSWHEDVVHDDVAGDRGAQADLAANDRRCQTGHAFFENEATQGAFVVLGPDDEYIPTDVEPDVAAIQIIFLPEFVSSEMVRSNFETSI